jgi:FkbH-like protein
VAEIEQMMAADTHAVYSLVVSDKFGNAGLTGVAVMRYESKVATVENFLMSCRVIGRGVETGIWTRIAADALQRGCTELRANFIPSAKNVQVADFYDRLGMTMTEEGDGSRQYVIAIADFDALPNPWIEMTYVE